MLDRAPNRSSRIKRAPFGWLVPWCSNQPAIREKPAGSQQQTSQPADQQGNDYDDIDGYCSSMLRSACDGITKLMIKHQLACDVY